MNPLRSKILATGTRARPARKVTLQLGDEPVTFELRQPNKAVMGQIGLEAGLDGEGKVRDIARLTATLIARCAYDAEGKRLFEDGDADALLALGAELDPACDAAVELMGATKEARDAGNGSGSTAS